MKCPECNGLMVPKDNGLEWWVCIECGNEEKMYT
jgi:DNA-directed RNA polymerase subunit M/transcription elongation factor TFIIS